MVYTGDLKFPAARLMGSSPIPDTKTRAECGSIRRLVFVVRDGTRKPELVHKMNEVNACQRGGVEST